jgi:hypothetical protein
MNEKFTQMSYQQVLKEKMILVYFLSMVKESNKAAAN